MWNGACAACLSCKRPPTWISAAPSLPWSPTATACAGARQRRRQRPRPNPSLPQHPKPAEPQVVQRHQQRKRQQCGQQGRAAHAAEYRSVMNWVDLMPVPVSRTTVRSLAWIAPRASST
ncbi:hypothetical protein G6F22_019083 [Rhizopus arrhizus]|nr:hypothetical protein G6F22_019083 [Rhizopus arrhizus]